MNKYIIAYVSFYYNDIKQILVEAESEKAAYIEYLTELGWSFDLDRVSTIADIKNALAKADAAISAYKL
jgi:hypothetical protein